MNELDPENQDSMNILAVYLIVNGEFQMSSGKLASQTFQACKRFLSALDDENKELKKLIKEWEEHGTRTITKFAPTKHLFDRCCQEIKGVTMIDEGLTEGTLGPTVHVTWPLRRGSLPRTLRHKKIRLYP